MNLGKTSFIMILAALLTAALLLQSVVLSAAEKDQDPSSKGEVAVREVIQSRLSQVRVCYEELVLSKNPTATVKVVVNFLIGKDGKASECLPTATPTIPQGTEFTACICDKIKSWDFPKPEQGSNRIKYTFIFQPDDGKGSK